MKLPFYVVEKTYLSTHHYYWKVYSVIWTIKGTFGAILTPKLAENAIIR